MASRDALAAIEKFANADATFDELVAARTAARVAARRLKKHGTGSEFEAAMAVCWAATNNHSQAAHYVALYAYRAGLDAKMMERICNQLRDHGKTVAAGDGIQ